MPIISENAKMRQLEAMITDFFTKEAGHLIVISNDRLFNNVLRKTLTTQLSLPLSSITIITGQSNILKVVKEMSVKKKRLLVLIEAVLDHERMDDAIRKINRRVRNAKLVVLTTETQLPRLALLREEGLADSWITKPIDINTLLLKIATNIRPPGVLEELIKQAEQCIENKAYRFALAACRKIFQIQPNSAVAYMIMGDAYRALDQVDDMIDAYEQANDMDEMYFDPLKKLESYFHEKGDKKNRVQYLERMDAISPYNLDRKLEIGSVHLDLGQDEDAQEMFEAAINLAAKEEIDDPGKVSTKVGDIYSEHDRIEAEDYYRRAMDFRGPRKSDMALYNSLGLSLRKQGRWQDAITEYQRAIGVVPDSDVLHYNMSLAYSDGNLYDQAYKAISKAFSLNPELSDGEAVVCYNAGLIYSSVGKVDEARKFLDKALSINPKYAAAKDLLSSL